MQGLCEQLTGVDLIYIYIYIYIYNYKVGGLILLNYI